MSYILEALKKSEQERGQGNIPGVQTVHSSSLMYRQEKKSFWPYLLVAVVLLNIVAIIYFIYTQNTGKTPTSDNLKTTNQQAATANPATHPPVMSTQAPSASNEQVQTERLHAPAVANSSTAQPSATQEMSRITPESSDKTETPPSTPAVNNRQPDTFTQTETSSLASSVTAERNESKPSSEHTAPEQVVIEQYDLPESVQQELPTLTISAHVYSENPQQRSMVINNQFLEEGDYVNDGLVLHEITPDGAIFKYNNILFHNGTVSGWQ